MNVYLVEDCNNGRILAVMASKEDAEAFADMLGERFLAQVTEQKLWYGQPTNWGYNE